MDIICLYDIIHMGGHPGVFKHMKFKCAVRGKTEYSMLYMYIRRYIYVIYVYIGFCSQK